MVSAEYRAEQGGPGQSSGQLSDMWSVATCFSGHLWPPQKVVKDKKNELYFKALEQTKYLYWLQPVM